MSRFIFTSLCLVLGFVQSAHAQSYWRKAIDCSSHGAGTAYIDIDSSNLRSVQLVIKNPTAIIYLTSISNYTNPELRVLDSSTALIQSHTGSPNFSPRDFHGLQTIGTFGSGFGWYYGNKVSLQNNVLSIDVIHNAYETCDGYTDSDGMCRGNVVFHPEQVIRNWNFPNCVFLY